MLQLDILSELFDNINQSSGMEYAFIRKILNICLTMLQLDILSELFDKIN